MGRTLDFIRAGINRVSEPEISEEYIRKRVIKMVIDGCYNYEIRDELGITNERIRKINCEHYQRGLLNKASVK